MREIRCETFQVEARDGVFLATDVYLPPQLPAPVIAMRTPYGRDRDAFVGMFLSFARRGYAVAAQDCRGTGKSQPDTWDYYMYEPEDGYDFVEWVSRQPWCDGFIGACGSSYTAQTQWQMALHPRMSTIVPEMSGLGFAVNTAHLYMYLNAYSRSVGKGAKKAAWPHELEALILPETLAGGFFNGPLHPAFPKPLVDRYPELASLPNAERKRWLWERYCELPCAGRAELVKLALGVENITAEDIESLGDLFGHRVPHDAHTIPSLTAEALVRRLRAPALLITGWYDWGLNDALATWEQLARHADEPVRSRSRLLITPSAHNRPGYHEQAASFPDLQRAFFTPNVTGLLLEWYSALREGRLADWPRVAYYLMGANEWRAAAAWPPPEARTLTYFLDGLGQLTPDSPRTRAAPDRYTYDPSNPTPTVGGSILSFVYTPGSVDVSGVQRRPDVLTYTTAPLEDALDVVGPIRLVLFASSSAPDTDFSARLSDVFPDGRALQIQSGILRARHRDPEGEPVLLDPGRIHRLEIDMWATANRFAAGHRVRLDISSSDFPRFDRNANRGGESGAPLPAIQSIYRDPEHPSHLVLSIVP